MRQMGDRLTSISSLDNKRRVRAAGTLALALTLAGTVSTEACAGGMGAVIGANVVTVPSSFSSVIMQPPRTTSPPVPFPQPAPGSFSSVQPGVQTIPGIVELAIHSLKIAGCWPVAGIGGRDSGAKLRRAAGICPARAVAVAAAAVVAGAAFPIPRYRRQQHQLRAIYRLGWGFRPTRRGLPGNLQSHRCSQYGGLRMPDSNLLSIGSIPDIAGSAAAAHSRSFIEWISSELLRHKHSAVALSSGRDR